MIPGPEIVVVCPRCEDLGLLWTLLSGNTFGARVRSDGRLFAPMFRPRSKIVACNRCDSVFWVEDAARVGQIDRLGRDGVPDRVPEEWTALRQLEEPDAEACLKALARKDPRDREQERGLRVLAMWKVNDLTTASSTALSQAPVNPALAMGGLIGLLALAMGIDTLVAAGSDHVASNSPTTFIVTTGLALSLFALAWVFPASEASSLESSGLPLESSMRKAHFENLEALIGLLDESEEGDRLMLADVYRQLGRFEEGAAVAAGGVPPEPRSAAAQIQALCEARDAMPRWLESWDERVSRSMRRSSMVTS